ncbi:unnamed protein product [Pseudo-nitzschia multistriata]|uniref:Uncharacterized protein n=1 Tax=Pseudo-nitzschia multistriata TaxID=183589 RepID=A0A448ZJZ7_9STRA|nr:unnamed protein product [Pseudo-nitzschia multistriata]
MISNTESGSEDAYSLRSGVARLDICSVLVLCLVGFYSLLANTYLFQQHESSLLLHDENDATLQQCLDSAGGLWTPQENNAIYQYDGDLHRKNISTDFRILCTSLNKRITWGSYRLRCNDLKRWTDVCAPNVDITVGVSIEQIHSMWGKKAHDIKNNSISRIGPNNNDSMNVDDIFYNATIFVKSLSRKEFPQFGNKFIDLVDEYRWKAENIPLDMHLIFQTSWQGPTLFPNHSSSVVEHWYNSYPSDMTNLGDPEYLPSIEQKSPRHLNIATIWNTRRSLDPTEGGCPRLKTPNVKYSCIDKEFDITSWYLDLFNTKSDECDMARTMASSQLGTGMLYYNLFRKFDALVVLAKNHTDKLEYGNVQRAISQMRSGVPILLEVRGRVFEDFMDKYNYSCAFRRYNDGRTSQKTRPLMSFDEAVEKMKSPEIRRQCQVQGLEIVKDYSPSKIGQKFLKAVGYHGEFQC